MSERVTIGVREPVAFLDWEVPTVMARVDTGARTSALHALGVEDGGDRVGFFVSLDASGRSRSGLIESDVVRRTVVRSSSGHSRDRIVVRTRVGIAGVEREIELTLASRPKMRHRLLLGRLALAGAFLIDPDEDPRHVTVGYPDGPSGGGGVVGSGDGVGVGPGGAAR